jgi:Tol biopolymer transport system component
MKITAIKSIWVTFPTILFFLFSCGPTQEIKITSRGENLLEGYRVIQRLEFPAKEGDVYSLTLNSDGRRLAYLWRGKRRSSVWIGDKKVSPDFGNITEVIAFCPDGSKVAYSAEARLNNMSVWVNNSRISPEFSQIVNVVFSPDCSTVAYRAVTHRDFDPKAWGKNSIWINGTRVSPEGSSAYPREPLFSPDGSKVAYVAEIDMKWSAWINDKRVSPEFDMIEGDLIFSPDGSSVAYTGVRDKIASIWIDGKRQFDNAYGPVFSPDGSRIAYRKKEEGRAWSVYINNKKVSPQFRLASNLVFSPDGSKVAYSGGGDKENQYVWIDDKRVSPEFSAFLIGDLVFSPDGLSVAYRVLLYRGKDGLISSIWINDKKVSPEFRNVIFAKEHFTKTGEIIFAGFDGEKREILHATPVSTR